MLAWKGAEGLDEFDHRVDRRGKLGRGLAHVPGMMVKVRGGHDAFVASKLQEFLPGILEEARTNIMPIEKQMIEEQIADTKQTIDLYGAAVKTFRNEIKNDLSSVRAAAASVEDSVRKMGSVYKETAALLTSTEFTTAIANAERLAAALAAISAVQSNNITFAVLGNKPTEKT